MASDGAADFTCGCMIIVVLVGAAFGLVYGCNTLIGKYSNYRESRKLEEYQRRASELSRKEQDEIESILRDFSEKELPDLQRLIDDMDRELKERDEALVSLEEELLRLGKDPDNDEDYTRWKRALANITSERDDLLRQREEAYLTFRKFELSPITRQSKAERDDRKREVDARIRIAREAFSKVLEEIASPAPTGNAP